MEETLSTGRMGGRGLVKGRKRVLFLLLALLWLGLWSLRILNAGDARLFLRRDVGGHGHGYLYYQEGLWARRVDIGYDNEIGVWHAALSPDGSRIAFKKDLLLNLYDLDSNRLTQISLEPNNPIGSTSIQWAPDGRRIGFPCQASHKEPLELCAWDVARQELHVLTDLRSYGNYDYLSFGGWSADTKTMALILFYPEDEAGKGLQRILRLDSATGQAATVLDSQQAGLDLDSEIALSPDGQSILFSGKAPLEEQSSAQFYALYRVGSDGGDLQRVVGGEHLSFLHPVWSPNGLSFYIHATNYYTVLPLRYDLSGRLAGALPLQIGRELVSWKREQEAGN